MLTDVDRTHLKKIAKVLHRATLLAFDIHEGKKPNRAAAGKIAGAAMESARELYDFVGERYHPLDNGNDGGRE